MQDLHSNKKIILLFPDGAGIRNFIYTDFMSEAVDKGLHITCWGRAEILDLIGRPVKKISLKPGQHTTPLAEVYRKSWQVGLLKYYARAFTDPVYLTYIFRSRPRSIKALIKYLAEFFTVLMHSDLKKLQHLKDKYCSIIRRTAYYQECKEILKHQNPDIVFCTHQRASEAIAPMLAAADMGIDTACFIYSWDNIPKATLYVEAKYYFVWSDYMKDEIIKHHPEIEPHRILVTGTPQFIPYFKDENIIPRECFATDFQLPEDREWICYSGDDFTTSPHDPMYLEDLCKAVCRWNEAQSQKLHVLFRRCPTEISARYDRVLQEYKSCLSAVPPAWASQSKTGLWNSVVPQTNDNKLLVSLARHCAMVVNIASTMSLDFGIKEKPCIYINYEQPIVTDWSAARVYEFVHFRSMGQFQPVIWLNSPDQWHEALKQALHHSRPFVQANRIWLNTICKAPVEDSNKRIVDCLFNL